jgi:non-ribosomal peptide synthetase component F
VPVRPSRLPAVLAGLGLAAVLTGCAGTDEPVPAGSSTSSSSSSPPSTSASAAPSAPAAGQRIEITVTGGRVSGDTGRVPVPAGEHVTLTITSDVADEVHVHGYDLTAALTPGTPASLTFDATIPGVFEVELHEAGTVLLSLQIG